MSQEAINIISVASLVISIIGTIVSIISLYVTQSVSRKADEIKENAKNAAKYDTFRMEMNQKISEFKNNSSFNAEEIKKIFLVISNMKNHTEKLTDAEIANVNSMYDSVSSYLNDSAQNTDYIEQLNKISIYLIGCISEISAYLERY